MNDQVKNKPLKLCLLPALYLAYLIVAAIPLSVSIFRPGITGYERAVFEDMIYGKAHKPFVKRQLVPLIVRGTTHLIPGPTKTFLQKKFSQSKLINQLGWTPEYASEFLLALLIMYGSLIGFLVVLRLFILYFLNISSTLSHIAVLAVGLGLPCTFVYKVYIYDFTQLLLFTACLLLLYQQRWHLFYPIYILACLNKETSILLPVVFLSCFTTNALKRPGLWHLLSQIIIGLGIYSLIGYIFRDNPGGAIEWHLRHNIARPFIISGFGKLRLIIFILFILLSLSKLHQAPVFLKRSLIATLPPLMCLAFLFGHFDELRDYYEALPLIYTLTLVAIGQKFGIGFRSTLI